MTATTFVSPESEFSEWKRTECGGWDYDYRDIILKPGVILPNTINSEQENIALIYVKDRGADDAPWHLAYYDNCAEDVYAHLVEESKEHRCYWRYALIPSEVITDISLMPSAEELIASIKKGE
jgi:hypothetical protein